MTKQGRVFTFGCSFTSYLWPTWADILIEEHMNRGFEGYNFGRGGVSNHYIFYRFMEMNQKYVFNEDDIIFISWTSPYREDRYLNGRWVSGGNIYNHNEFGNYFKKNLTNPTHYILSNAPIISATKKILSSIGCDHFFLSMDKFFNDKSLIENDIITKKIFNYYKIKIDLPPIRDYLELINNKRVEVIHGDVVYDDEHPTPKEHLKYYCDVIKPIFNYELTPKTQKTINYWIQRIDKSKNPIKLYDNMGNTAYRIYNHKGTELISDDEENITRKRKNKLI